MIDLLSHSQNLGLLHYQTGTNDVSMLEKNGVSLVGTHIVQGNHIFLHARSDTANRFAIEFSGAGNIVVLGENANIHGHILFRGNRNQFVSGGHPATLDRVALDTRFMGADDSEVNWGEGSTSNGAQIVVQGSNRRVTVGPDCMFASGIWLRASDMHAIVDLATGDIINAPRDISIGRHVWIGQDVLILKGSRIGDGAIVGARAMVTGAVASCSLATGAPARTLKEKVSWTRNPNPTAAEIEAVQRYGPNT